MASMLPDPCRDSECSNDGDLGAFSSLDHTVVAPTPSTSVELPEATINGKPPEEPLLHDVDVATERPRISRARILLKDVGRSLLLLALLFLPYLLYAFFVGLIFLAIERDAKKQAVDNLFAEFLALDFDYNQTLFLNSQFGLGVPYNATDYQWDVISSMYYVITFSSTIGYGDFVPITPEGRGLTAFFAILGIPLLGYTFLAVGQLLMRLCVALPLLLLSPLGLQFVANGRRDKAEKAVARLLELNRPLTLQDLHTTITDWDKDAKWFDTCAVMEMADVDASGLLDRDEVEKALYAYARQTADKDVQSCDLIFLYVIVLMISWMCLGALVFAHMEDISWAQGFWLCYVSLTSIGFGDVTPTFGGSRFFWIAYIYLGMGLMAYLVVAVFDRLVAAAKYAARSGQTVSYTFDVVFVANPVNVVIRRVVHVVLPPALLLGYALAGAVMFSALEGPASLPTVDQWDALVSAPDNPYNLTDAQRDFLLASLWPPSAWDFADSFYFAFTTICTVGYGIVVPETTAGRTLVLVYSVFGIGLAAFCLARFADHLYDALDAAVGVVTRCCGREHHLLRESYFEERAQILFEEIVRSDGITLNAACALVDHTLEALNRRWLRHMVEAIDDGDGVLDHNELMILLSRYLTSKRRKLVVQTALFNVTCGCLVTLVFAGVWTALEPWNYGQALWFSFITLSTIGFGDYVPTDAGGEIFGIFTILVNMGFFANGISLAGPLSRAVYVTVRNWWALRRSPKRVAGGSRRRSATAGR